MVEQLMLLARAETGQLPLTLEPVPFRALLDECWSTFAARAERRSVRVEWKIANDLVITSDRAKLQMIIHNLLDNAVTYVNDNGVISIEAAAEGEGLSLSIANTGSHLAPEEAAHAFDRFWRGDPSRRDTGAHCGLGLTLCARLVALLGGTIRLSSVSGGLFTVMIHLGVSR
jgi:two-component system heavy metal sensor histidine kinase CusS